MLFLSIIFVSLCFAANLKRKRSDSAGSVDHQISKHHKADGVPLDVWPMVLFAGNFESAQALALTNPALYACVSKTVYQYLYDKASKLELLDENTILRLLPLFVNHLRAARRDDGLAHIFWFFFRHADSHAYASKIFKTWKSLDLSLEQDRSLLRYLNDSVNIPPENPLTSFLKLPLTLALRFSYQYIYPVVLLRCGEYNRFVWNELFHILVKFKYLNNQGAGVENFKSFMKNLWNDIPRWQQEETLERISLAVAYYTGKFDSEESKLVSKATLELVGHGLPELPKSDILKGLEEMDESTYLDIIRLGRALQIKWGPSSYEFVNVRSGVGRNHNQAYRAFCAALVECDFDKLKFHRSWGPSKLWIMAVRMSDPAISDEVRMEFARHVWRVTDIDGMLIFSHIINDKSEFLCQSLNELMSNPTDRSVLEVITSIHLKFIEMKNIDDLGAILYERVTNELLLMVESYVPGQKPSPLNAKLANPDLSNLLMKCIRNNETLASQLGKDALLRTLPSLKRYI